MKRVSHLPYRETQKLDIEAWKSINAKLSLHPNCYNQFCKYRFVIYHVFDTVGNTEGGTSGFMYIHKAVKKAVPYMRHTGESLFNWLCKISKF